MTITMVFYRRATDLKISSTPFDSVRDEPRTVREIQIKTERLDIPIRAKVVKVIPKTPEESFRTWIDKNGNLKVWSLTDWNIEDIENFEPDFVRYIQGNAVDWANRQKHTALPTILPHYLEFPKLVSLALEHELCQATRTHSGFLYGYETLGIEALPSDAKTLPGCRPLPRLVAAGVNYAGDAFLAQNEKALFGQGGAFVAAMQSKEKLRVDACYAVIRVLYEGCVIVLDDMKRREKQGTPAANNRRAKFEITSSFKNITIIFIFLLHFAEEHKGPRSPRNSEGADFDQADVDRLDVEGLNVQDPSAQRLSVTDFSAKNIMTVEMVQDRVMGKSEPENYLHLPELSELRALGHEYYRDAKYDSVANRIWGSEG